MHFRTLTFCIVSIKNRTNFLDTLFLLKCTTLQRLAKKECDTDDNDDGRSLPLEEENKVGEMDFI